jgi:hypothetical protein
MSRARNLADLLDANGDVASGALDNVPPSNDASALTTGTLPIARIADGDVTTAKLASTLDLSGKTVNFGLASADMPSGSVVGVSWYRSNLTDTTVANAATATLIDITYNVKSNNTYLFGFVHSGQIKKTAVRQNPRLWVDVDESTGSVHNMELNHVGYDFSINDTQARQHATTQFYGGPFTAGNHRIRLIAGCYDESGTGIIYNFQCTTPGEPRAAALIVYEVAG